uniref:Uncharacterized protein n=1 Tax=Rhizophora mucronata TaxID=61149 RepID=A0A2P2IVT3_RHIMU
MMPRMPKIERLLNKTSGGLNTVSFIYIFTRHLPVLCGDSFLFCGFFFLFSFSFWALYGI